MTDSDQDAEYQQLHTRYQRLVCLSTFLACSLVSLYGPEESEDEMVGSAVWLFMRSMLMGYSDTIDDSGDREFVDACLAGIDDRIDANLRLELDL